MLGPFQSSLREPVLGAGGSQCRGSQEGFPEEGTSKQGLVTDGRRRELRARWVYSEDARAPPCVGVEAAPESARTSDHQPWRIPRLLTASRGSAAGAELTG